jgi:hypothetical protein
MLQIEKKKGKKLWFLIGVIIFGLVQFLSKTNNQTEIKKKKTGTRSNRPVSVRFGFLGQKPDQTGFGSFFSCLTQLFSVWLGFFRFGFGLVFSVLDL